MCTSNINGSLAWVASVATLIFSLYKFFYKKEKIFVSLVNCEGFETSSLNLILAISNKGNQNITITDCKIFFFEGKNIVVEAKGQSKLPFDPFILYKEEQKIINLSSTVPEIKFYEKIRYNVKVKIDYINSKGYVCTDSKNIGHIEVRHLMIFKLSINQSLTYKLSCNKLNRKNKKKL